METSVEVRLAEVTKLPLASHTNLVSLGSYISTEPQPPFVLNTGELETTVLELFLETHCWCFSSNSAQTIWNLAFSIQFSTRER